MTAADLPGTPRLVLLGGPGGAGVSSATASLAVGLARAGRAVAVADLDPYHGASSRLASSTVEVVPAGTSDAVGPAAAMLDRLGLEPRLATEIATLPGADTVQVLHRLAPTLARADLDMILVDLGSRIVDVVALADRLPWLVGQLLPAQRGWLSSTRPRTATVLSRWPGADGLATVQRWVGRVVGWADLVRAADTHLVSDPADPRLRRLQLGLALHELPAPGAVPAETLAEWRELPERAVPAKAGLIAQDGGWTWRLALPGLRSQEVRVDRSGDDLALEVLGIRRLVPLPSVMRRFRTAGARVATGHLEITFVPEESTT